MQTQLFDVTIIIVLEFLIPCCCNMTNYTNKDFAIVNCSNHHSLSHTFGLLSPCDTTILKLGSLIIPHWPLTLQRKGIVSHLCLEQKARYYKV